MQDAEITQHKWIVTGTEGLLGNTIVRRLFEAGARVRAGVYPDREPESLAGIECEKFYADITDPADVARLFDGAGADTFIIHCAGIVSIANQVRREVRSVNVGGTRNIVYACREHSVARLVYTSSVHALPEDDGIITETKDITPAQVVGEYAKTKAEGTRLVLDAENIDRVVVHPSGILGPGDYGDGHLTRLIRDLMNGRLTSIVNGGYDFADVRDIADACIAAAYRGRNGENYILNGTETSIREMSDLVCKTIGRKRTPTVLPTWFAKLTAPAAELWYKLRGTAPLYTRYSLYTLQAPAQFSHAKASAELGYSTRPVEETIVDTVRWIQKHPQ